MLELPKVRTLLWRWRTPLRALAHERVVEPCAESVEDTLLDVVARLQPELVVASTHARTGLGRMFHGSVAEGVARNLAVPALLVPLGGQSFVDTATGALHLERWLLPVETLADAERAVRAARSFARFAGMEGGEFVLLHVEDGRPPPALEPQPGFRIVLVQARGPIEEAVAETADAQHTDLIVMVTAGHDSARDVLLASHTERVLHRARRPLLWVPRASQRRA